MVSPKLQTEKTMFKVQSNFQSILAITIYDTNFKSLLTVEFQFTFFVFLNVSQPPDAFEKVAYFLNYKIKLKLAK
jgi:hypothetical protein